MEKLITWFDVETVINKKKLRKDSEGWPNAIVGISVYEDEIQIRIKDEKDIEVASNTLSQWFGPRYFKEEFKIILESSPNEKKRSLDILFQVDPNEKRNIYKNLKPSFSSLSLYPEDMPLELKGPDFSKLENLPSIWAFYSFKGGVGRTLHLISLVKALSELEPGKKILIVDADLEAPGLTWWAKDETGKPDISFLDFLALAHYDDSDDYSETLKITSERIRPQMLTFETGAKRVEHFFLPAFREFEQLMRMPIRPENVCWEIGKEWLVPELLGKLGKVLGVDAVVVDLRAGLSEISSPFLFDPRVNRFIVTTPSSQSIEGTKHVLNQIKKISLNLEEKYRDYETQLPTVILSMVQEELDQSPEIDKAREELQDFLISENSKVENELEKEVVVETLFDSNLLLQRSLISTLEKLDKADMQKKMQKIAQERFATIDNDLSKMNSEKGEISEIELAHFEKDLIKLEETAETFEFAELGKSSGFLITQPLRKIARKFESTIPVAVVMGAKGSGKTYTYLQLAHLKEWNKFLEKVGESSGDKLDGLICPLLTSKGLVDKAKDIIETCRTHVEKKTKNVIQFKPQFGTKLENLIENQKGIRDTNIANWRNFWVSLMAQALSCENAEDPMAEMQRILAESNTRVIFQFDGLEDYFKQIKTDDIQKIAIEALCQSVVNALNEWPDNRIGLLIFIRKDIVESSITQNFGQFEARYRSLELKWERDEALRLVAWLVNEAAGLQNYANYLGPIENFSEVAVEEALFKLWGKKMGTIKSREANTANWVISALSNFNGQLQARDLVRLIKYAASKSKSLPRYSDNRLLIPSAIKNALEPCSKDKIKEIKMEITILNDIFQKLENIPEKDRVVPFKSEQFGLTSTEIQTMTSMGVITQDEGEYYFPEIIRHGLKFAVSGRGRSRVLTLLKRSLDR